MNNTSISSKMFNTENKHSNKKLFIGPLFIRLNIN